MGVVEQIVIIVVALCQKGLDVPGVGLSSGRAFSQHFEFGGYWRWMTVNIRIYLGMVVSRFFCHALGKSEEDYGRENLSFRRYSRQILPHCKSFAAPTYLVVQDQTNKSHGAECGLRR